MDLNHVDQCVNGHYYDDNNNILGILLLSPSEVNLCPGDELILTCSTNETFLQWRISTSVRRLVPSQGAASELEPLTINSTTFYISKVSDNEAVPLISTITVYNVTADLNRTAVNCAEIDENGQIERMSTAIIQIIRTGTLCSEAYECL